MKNIKYSIIFGVIRSEISERISIGLILMNGDEVKIVYSDEKLNALQQLYSPKEFEFLKRVIHAMPDEIKTTQAVDYLVRYSNNLITLSQPKTIDLEPTAENEQWLFNNYIYNSQRMQ